MDKCTDCDQGYIGFPSYPQIIREIYATRCPTCDTTMRVTITKPCSACSGTGKQLRISTAQVRRNGVVIGRVEPDGKVYKDDLQVGWIQRFVDNDVACRVYNSTRYVGSSDKDGTLQWPDSGRAGKIDSDGWVYKGGIVGQVEPSVPFLLMGGAALLLLVGGAEYINREYTGSEPLYQRKYDEQQAEFPTPRIIHARPVMSTKLKSPTLSSGSTASTAQTKAKNSRRALIIGGLALGVGILSIPFIASTVSHRNQPLGEEPTPTPVITPISPTQENTFTAGQTWKGSSSGCGCADEGQGILKIATINPDSSFAGSFEHIAPNYPADDTYSITGTIVHDFSDPNWQIVFVRDGMDPKIPGIWSTFRTDNFEGEGNLIFYNVARDSGHIDGYALRDDGDGNTWHEIHLDKIS